MVGILDAQTGNCSYASFSSNGESYQTVTIDT